jgi:hypothetical protein
LITVAVLIWLPPLVAVYHPLKVYPARVGFVGSVPTADHAVTSLLVGECPVPPFPLNVTVY